MDKENAVKSQSESTEPSFHIASPGEGEPRGLGQASASKDLCVSEGARRSAPSAAEGDIGPDDTSAQEAPASLGAGLGKPAPIPDSKELKAPDGSEESKKAAEEPAEGEESQEQAEVQELETASTRTNKAYLKPSDVENGEPPQDSRLGDAPAPENGPNLDLQPSGVFETVDQDNTASSAHLTRKVELGVVVEVPAREDAEPTPRPDLPSPEGLRRQWVQQQKQSGHAGKEGTWGFEQTSVFKSVVPIAEQVGKTFERLASYVEEKVVGVSQSAPPTPSGGATGTDSPRDPLASPVSVLNKGLARFQRAAAITFAGGVEAYWRQKLSPAPDEKLKNAFACSLVVSLGAISGVLFLSSHSISFCSDKCISQKNAQGEMVNELYKVMLPLDKVTETSNIESKQPAPYDKYLKVATTDKREFWFFEFLLIQ